MGTRLVGKLKPSEVVKRFRSNARSNIGLQEILSEVFCFYIGLVVFQRRKRLAKPSKAYCT